MGKLSRLLHTALVLCIFVLFICVSLSWAKYEITFNSTNSDLVPFEELSTPVSLSCFDSKLETALPKNPGHFS